MNDLIIALNERAEELKREVEVLKKEIVDLRNTVTFQDNVINNMSARIYRMNLERLNS